MTQFDSNYDRICPFDLINYQNNSLTSFERLAVWNSTTEFTPYPSAKAFVYAGGASEIARDGNHFFVYLHVNAHGYGTVTTIGLSTLIGDSLLPTRDGSILILAFVIGLVSCWSSLILGISSLPRYIQLY
jgi:hypothetical protein